MQCLACGGSAATLRERRRPRHLFCDATCQARYYDVDAAKVDDGTLTEKIDALALTENKPIQGLFEVFVAKPEVPKNTGLEIFRQALLARHGPNPSFETQVLFLTKQLHELLEAPMPSSIVEDRTGKENRVLDWFFHTSSSSDVLIMFGKAQDRLKRHVFGQAVFRLSVALAIRLMSRYGVDPWGHLYAAGSSLSLSGMFTRARRVWAPVTMDDGRGLVFIGDRLAKQEKANILRLSQIAGALLRRGDILNALDIDRGCVVALASMGSQNAELVMEFLAGIVRVRGVPVEFILPRDTLLLCSFAERMDVFLAMLKTVEGSPLFQQIARQKGDEFHAVLVRLFVQRRPWQFGDDALRVLLAARLPFFFSHIILQPAMENATLSEELGCAIIAKAEEFRLLATILAFSNSVRYIDCYLARPDVSDLPPESFNWHVAYAIRLHSSLLFPEPDRRYPKKLMLLRLAPRCADSELLLSLLSMDRLDAVDAFFREDAAAIVSGLLVEGSRDQIRAFFASKMVQDMPLASPKVAAALFSPLTGQEVGIHLDRAMMIIDEALMHGLDRDVLGFLFLEARSTSFRLALLQKYDIQLTDYEWDKTRQSSPELSDDIAAHRARQAAEADARRAKEDEEAVTKSRRLKQAVY